MARRWSTCLCRQLAAELGPHGGRVAWLFSSGSPDAIADGEGEDQPQAGHHQPSDGQAGDLLASAALLGRRSSYDDGANAAAFLASDWARTMTATEVNITGEQSSIEQIDEARIDRLDGFGRVDEGNVWTSEQGAAIGCVISLHRSAVGGDPVVGSVRLRAPLIELLGRAPDLGVVDSTRVEGSDEIDKSMYPSNARARPTRSRWAST